MSPIFLTTESLSFTCLSAHPVACSSVPCETRVTGRHFEKGWPVPFVLGEVETIPRVFLFGSSIQSIQTGLSYYLFRAIAWKRQVKSSDP
ncbi:hypothetical protein DL96DRAFT_301199 [Flagelloscypha sp. PMI_526]|nr:hypothetical protein DL96DRAFT_301199 [Flagelloscypha sp. PMI_526]